MALLLSLGLRGAMAQADVTAPAFAVLLDPKSVERITPTSGRVSVAPGLCVTIQPGADNQNLPDDFIIDYVRCWQRRDLASEADKTGLKP
jgi:hypothetical protein